MKDVFREEGVQGKEAAKCSGIAKEGMIIFWSYYTIVHFLNLPLKTRKFAEKSSKYYISLVVIYAPIISKSYEYQL